MTIKKASIDDLSIVSDLSIKLWPHHSLCEMEKEYSKLLLSNERAVFLYFDGTFPVAFAQCQLRFDYIEGTKTSPVGYLEGIFVEEQYRNKKIASELLHNCETWAKSVGCKEFASDCELGNSGSFLFHLKTGFAEVNRIICFTKKL